MSCEQLFQKQLRRHGLRLTPQREKVLSVLHDMGRAASAEEIFALVAQKDASVDRSTVYRTLDLLSEMNLAAVIDSGEKLRRYELSGIEAPHMHLVCRSCGQITGVELERLQPLLDELKTNFHFNIDLSSLTLQGLCDTCAGEN
jgi:Fur family transcriptional regulator, ferric uptake regulator